MVSSRNIISGPIVSRPLPYLFFANVNPPYDVRARVLADIQRQNPKFIIAKPDRVSEELKKPSSPSHLAFYQYLTSHYEEVDPGLYRRR